MKYLSNEYKSYMSSQAWYRRRAMKLLYAGALRGFVECEMCHREFPPTRVDCHHLTYERLGCERLSDLQVLCRTCHQIIGAHPAIHELADVDALEDELLAMLAKIDCRVAVDGPREAQPRQQPAAWTALIAEHGREPNEDEAVLMVQAIIERKRKRQGIAVKGVPK